MGIQVQDGTVGSANHEEVLAAITPGNQNPTSVKRIKDVVDFSALFEANTNIVCLQRTPTQMQEDEAQAAILSLSPTQFILDPSIAKEKTPSELDEFPLLAQDVSFLSELLSDLCGCNAVGLSLIHI